MIKNRIKLAESSLDGNENSVFTQEECLFSDAKIKAPMLDALENYIKNPCVPLHIPGHARGGGVLPRFKELVGQKMIELDTTDAFNGLGSLTPATGAIKEAQDLAAKAFGAEKSYFLLNGSTVGNLALALSVVKENEKIIVGRNCHKSVISGLTLTGAVPVWEMPDLLEQWGIWGSVSPAKIENLLDENPDVKVVWVTNPTYEGVVSDIESIASICKTKKVTLIVDEAHGALWGFNSKFPKPALECGADAVVTSMHKTAGSFSQSSILHVGKNSNINIEQLELNLSMLHSTSPSYVLLASIDAARAYLETSHGQAKIDKAIKNAEMLRESLRGVEGVSVLSSSGEIDIDLSRIYLMIDGLSGKRLENILEVEYNIEVESAIDKGILALSNIGNTPEDLYYFSECIKKIASKTYSAITTFEKIKYMPFHVPKIHCSPRKAYMSNKEKVLPEESVGRISAEVIALCPPGIPVFVPGEVITKEHLPYLADRNFVQVIKD